MAFVVESMRDLDVKPPSALGPGAYFQVAADSPRGKDAYAPFLSTSKRHSITQQNKLVPPGPGQYQISTKIIQPIIQTLSNSHSIIVKINSTGTVPFKSVRERFDDKYSQVPGPGSYTPSSSQQPYARTDKSPTTDRNAPHANALQSIRDLNKRRRNATIPNRVTSLIGSKQSQSVKDPKQLELEMGPGKYNLPGGFGQGRGALWGRDMIKRFSMQEQPGVGPGKYTPTDGSKPQYKYNPSSTFISDTVRTHFDSLYFRTNQNFKAKIRMKSNYKVPDPGPGQYQCNVSAIELKSTPFPFQFFGSTVERFDQNQAAVLGPGAYKLPSAFQDRRPQNKAALSFNSTGERDTSFLDLHTEKVPGPGSYTQQLIHRPKLYSKQRKMQMFGVAQKRFEGDRQAIEKPGPGAYFDQTDPSKVNPNHPAKQPTNCVFKSSTTRQCFGEVKKQTTPFAAYDVDHFDMSSKLEKQKVFIQNLKKIDVEKAPFDSSHSRFPHYQAKPAKKEGEPQNKDNKPRVQSGTHEKKTRSLNPSPQIIRPAFLIAQKRFNDGKRGAPGVGVYELKSPWQKRSFNVKYQPQNTGKK